jgi:predicted DNA-binding WGR domain protein
MPPLPALQCQRLDGIAAQGLSGPVSLICVEPGKRKFRFYKLFIAPSLFGEWMVVRQWGRIDGPGRVRSDRCENAGAALLASQKLMREKLQRGYTMRWPT